MVQHGNCVARQAGIRHQPTRVALLSKDHHSNLELRSGRARTISNGQACNHMETDLMVTGVCKAYA